jgi:hypothetical protein
MVPAVVPSVDRRSCDLRAAALAALLPAGCGVSGCDRSGGARQAPTHAQIVREEESDVDAAVKHIPSATKLVDSYRFEDERLSVFVDAGTWRSLGPGGQEAFKKALWSAWATSYARRNGPSGARIFLSVYDMQNNDLGSYFAH